MMPTDASCSGIRLRRFGEVIVVPEAVPGPEWGRREHSERGQEPVEILEIALDDVAGDRDDVRSKLHQLLENRPEHLGVEERPGMNVAQEQDPEIGSVARPARQRQRRRRHAKRRGSCQQYGCQTPKRCGYT